MRQLSRNLVSLWCAENELATNMLKRILPAGLLSFLESTEQVPKDMDLMKIRDNLKLAIEQNTEKSRFRANMPQKLLNAQSVKLIEKQMNNVLQHWKQRVSPAKTEVSDCQNHWSVFFSIKSEFIKNDTNSINLTKKSFWIISGKLILTIFLIQKF